MIRLWIRRGLLYRITPRVSYLKRARMICFYRIGFSWASPNRQAAPK
jgi:hypothetical protein